MRKRGRENNDDDEYTPQNKIQKYNNIYGDYNNNNNKNDNNNIYGDYYINNNKNNKFIYKSSKVFNESKDQQQCQEIICAMLTKLKNIPLEIIIECGEYATGLIVDCKDICNGINNNNQQTCDGQFHILYGDNWNLEKYTKWKLKCAPFIRKERQKYIDHLKKKKMKIRMKSEEDESEEEEKEEEEDPETQELLDDDVLFDEYLFNNDLVQDENASIIDDDSMSEKHRKDGLNSSYKLNPYSPKFIGPKEYNGWRAKIYSCDNPQCKKEMNIFYCSYIFCQNPLYGCQNGEAHGCDGGIDGCIRAPPGVCSKTVAIKTDNNKCKNDNNYGIGECFHNFCPKHMYHCGKDCQACGDYYCMQCVNKFGIKCWDKSCDRFFCSDHTTTFPSSNYTSFCCGSNYNSMD